MAFKEARTLEEDGGQSSRQLGPLIVRFPRHTPPVESVKLESEHPEVESKPRHMIQVYLMAGYLVGRWAWARFQERQSRRNLSGRNNRKQ